MNAELIEEKVGRIIRIYFPFQDREKRENPAHIVVQDDFTREKFQYAVVGSLASTLRNTRNYNNRVVKLTLSPYSHKTYNQQVITCQVVKKLAQPVHKPSKLPLVEASTTLYYSHHAYKRRLERGASLTTAQVRKMEEIVADAQSLKAESIIIIIGYNLVYVISVSTRTVCTVMNRGSMIRNGIMDLKDNDLLFFID